VAWADIDLYAVNYLMTAAAMNALADDLTYLHAPNFAVYHHPGTGGVYTLAAGNYGQDVDATNFNLTITTTGGPVMTLFSGMGLTSDATTSARFTIVHLDPISYMGRNEFNVFDAEIESATAVPVCILKPFDNLPAGSHTFRLTWGVGGTGSGTLNVVEKPFLAAWEGT